MRAAGRPLKVLHVDDDPLNLRVVQEILAAFGHAAVSCASGRARGEATLSSRSA